MRTLTIGSTTLQLANYFPKWNNIGGVYAEIEIPTSEIAFDDLKALLDKNQHDLVITNENGTKETYSGYSKLQKLIADLDREVYVATQYCTDTAHHLINEARKQIETLKTEKAELQREVNTQGQRLTECAIVINAQGATIENLQTEKEELQREVNAQGTTIETLQIEKAELQREVNAQGEQLAEQGETIAEQGERIAEQKETIEAQNEEIAMLNDTLLEVLMG